MQKDLPLPMWDLLLRKQCHRRCVLSPLSLDSASTGGELLTGRGSRGYKGIWQLVWCLWAHERAIQSKFLCWDATLVWEMRWLLRSIVGSCLCLDTPAKCCRSRRRWHRWVRWWDNLPSRTKKRSCSRDPGWLQRRPTSWRRFRAI